MPAALTIATIVGSTRQNRFCDKPARWIHDVAAARDGVEAVLLDLLDYPLPFFAEPTSPLRFNGVYPNEVAGRWARQIDAADAYIIVSPEYNHGYPAVLKNAMDWLYTEWVNKPVGFVSYGGVGGARAVQQLRQVAIELQMAPVRNAVHLSVDTYRAVMNERVPANPELFSASQVAADRLLDQLIWWANALKAARFPST